MNLKEKSVINAKAVVIGALACLLFVIAFFIFQALNGQIVNTDGKHFGIGADTGSASTQVGVVSAGINANEGSDDEPSIGASLVSYPQRDITDSLSAILIRKEENERARQEIIRIDEINHISRAKNNRQHQIATVGLPPLSEINWDAGHATFVAEWGSRINAYLAGSALAGQGETFAEAAWEEGIDPRWSPAISNTESGKGSNCFKSHNAWGWGSSGWPDWGSAIYDHVAGLANSYGYSIAYSYASKYCPPNSDHWYSSTLNEMASI